MSTANALERFKEFILTVRIYVPWKHRAGKYVKAGGKFPQASQEFLIPGNMTLDKLRDRIGCPEDFQDMNTDISENPLQPISIRSGDVYKSAMFYIGNVFYIDTRHSDNIDYSEVVKKWAVRKKINLHRTEIMEKTCVNSLVARLGYPYLYVHQGCCEHLIVITDAR
ncbi:hypothetical protein AAG570_006788 [Ranatra chinensis]|uniref:snRNA-activating protein complex subunit 3 n=1 Tax=Ranatra chinensis TaxID=642074 RepID=A0ABD0YV39_9HEMI